MRFSLQRCFLFSARKSSTGRQALVDSFIMTSSSMAMAPKLLSESSEKFEFGSVSSTEVPVTPTSCVELLKEVAEGAVASLLDDDDSFNSQPSNPLLDTPPNSHTAAFLAGWLSGSQAAAPTGGSYPCNARTSDH